MGKHTKGPWEAKKADTSIGHVWQIEQIGACIYVDDGGVEWRPADEAEANARLIAAAPDLLEALSEVLGPLATIPMGEGGSPEEQVPEKANLRVSEAAIHRARAAIARATGGSP